MPMERLTPADARARAEQHPPALDITAIISSAAASPPSPSALAWPAPLVTPDGSCSVKLDPTPFSIVEELTAAGEDAASATRRVWALRRVCEALADVTRAEWVGVYEAVAPSARAPPRGGSGVARNLLKLAYIGAPSRPFFPLTPEFATGSNNSTVGLSGDTVIIHDVRALATDAPYYICDGKVRSEVCAPIYGVGGDVIGIIDAEAFRPDAFRSPDALAAILHVCHALGDAALLR